MTFRNVGEAIGEVEHKMEIVGHYVPEVLLLMAYLPIDRSVESIIATLEDFYDELTDERW